MQIEKIRHKNTETEIHWTVPNGQDREESSLKSEDAPEQAFIDALEALKDDFLEACELPKTEKFREKVTLSTISVSRDVHGRRGFIMSATVKVASGAYSISTPRLRAPADETDAESPVLLDEHAMERIEAMIDEAIRYVKGNRTQMELPLEGAPDKESNQGVDPFDPAAAAEAEHEHELAGAGAH